MYRLSAIIVAYSVFFAFASCLALASGCEVLARGGGSYNEFCSPVVIIIMPKRKSKFSEELQKKFPCFSATDNDFSAKCKICNCAVSVSHGGGADLKHHMDSEKHRKNLRSTDSSLKMTTYFVNSNTHTQEQKNVAAAEGTMSFHVVKHHQSYRSNDCSVKLQKKKIPDSKIAEKVSCGRTKCEAIMNNVIGPHSQKLVIAAVNSARYFSISTDASNHGHQKIFPVIVQYFSVSEGGLQIKLLDLDELVNEKSESISNYLSHVIQSLNITSKCVAFGADNTNCNFGGLKKKEGNNVFTHLKVQLKNSNIVGIGCPAHVVHNTLQSACDVLPVDVDCIVMKLYNHFHIFSIRVAELIEFSEFVGVTYRNLLSFSKTRWLSLLPAIERILKMFEPLKSYFLSQSNSKCPAILKSFFSDPINECYLLLIHSQMSVFQHSILSIEKENNSICEVLAVLSKVLKSLNSRKREHFIPLSVKQLLNDCDDQSFKKFDIAVSTFYDVSVDYLSSWLHGISEFSIFSWMLLTEPPEWSVVENTLMWLKEKGILVNDSLLFDEIVHIQSFVKQQVETDSEHWNQLMAHEKWCMFFNSCKCNEQFRESLNIAQYFFSLPAHNANVERVFSLLSSQWTDERNRFTVRSVRCILLTCFNFSKYNCTDFYSYLLGKPELLNEISSSKKYDWSMESTRT